MESIFSLGNLLKALTIIEQSQLRTKSEVSVRQLKTCEI